VGAPFRIPSADGQAQGEAVSGAWPRGGTPLTCSDTVSRLEPSRNVLTARTRPRTTVWSAAACSAWTSAVERGECVGQQRDAVVGRQRPQAREPIPLPENSTARSACCCPRMFTARALRPRAVAHARTSPLGRTAPAAGVRNTDVNGLTVRPTGSPEWPRAVTTTTGWGRPRRTCRSSSPGRPGPGRVAGSPCLLERPGVLQHRGGHRGRRVEEVVLPDADVLQRRVGAHAPEQVGLA
jgi:hypothetical protein